MSNYERKLGNQGYGVFGKGSFIKELPVTQRLTFSDFSGGLDTRDSREDTEQNSSPNALDVEVTKQDRLRRVPGTTTSETLARVPEQMLLQASLDYTSELVLFDSPYMGVKRGAVTTWFNAGLPEADRLFAAVNFGGSLVFSNGRVGLYIRESGKDSVELIEHGPAAHTFASFAGRIFAGSSIIGGNREPLGISWSGASSDPKEWDVFDENGSQTGAGSELLIDDMVQGNYIVALRTMGLDFMAVMLRHSVWIGRRTQQLLRPADFQPRVSGVGALGEAACAVTRFGVVHLHDSGMYLFDGNNTELISEQINNELLPIDMTQVDSYRVAYNPLTKMVFLLTPVCTWVYDMEKRRWHKRSIVARGASLFAPQLSAKTWGEILGTWAAQDDTAWEDYKSKETAGVDFLYLGNAGVVSVLAKEDATSPANFGTTMEPYWELPLLRGDSNQRLLSTSAVILEYVGGGEIAIELPDNDAIFSEAVATALRPVTTPQTRVIGVRWTGKGASARLTFASGLIEILRVQLEVLKSGMRIEEAEFEPLVEVSSGFLGEDDFERANGALGTNWRQDTGPSFLISGGIAEMTNVSALKLAWISGLPAHNGNVVETELRWDLSEFGIAARFQETPRRGLFLTKIGSDVYLYSTLPTAFQNTVPVASFPAAAATGYRKVKLEATNTSRRGWIDGVQLFTTANVNDPAPNAVGTVAIGTRSPNPGTVGRWKYVKYYKSNFITVTGVPAGYSIRVGAKIAAGGGGTISLDLAEQSSPQTKIELLNAAGHALFSLSPVGGVWGGGVYQCNVT